MEIELKELIRKCNSNIKGMSRNEEINRYLPIKEENIEIYIEGKIMYIKNKQQIKKIYEQDGYYSNLEIIKEIANIYGVKLRSNKILDLIKFKNMVEIIIL